MAGERFEKSTDPRDAPYGGRRIGMAPPGAHQNPDGSWDWDAAPPSAKPPAAAPKAAPPPSAAPPPPKPAPAPVTPPPVLGVPPPDDPGAPDLPDVSAPPSMAALSQVGQPGEGFGLERMTPLKLGQGRRSLPASSRALALLASMRGANY